MSLLQQAKQFVGRSRLARDLVLQYRIRTGQPDWSHVTSSPRFQEALAKARAGKRRVLIATSDGAYLGATRMESLIALALTERGVDVHVLLCDGVLPACQEATLHWYLDPGAFAERGPTKLHCGVCFKPAYDMYRSLGVTVHRYSDFLTDEDRAFAERVAATTPDDQIRAYRKDDIAIGEHAVAGAIRFYARANIGTTDVERAIVRRYFRAGLLATALTRRLLRSRAFEAAVFHHGIYVPQGLIGEVARQEKVRVVNWHVAYRKQCFLFSHDNTYHHTLMDEPTAAWDQIAWDDRLEHDVVEYLKSRWQGSNDWIHFNRAPQSELDAIAAEVGVDLSKPTIGMLTNVMWDAQLHYPANAFRDMLDWTLKTIAYFARRPELQLVIRAHPAEMTGRLPSLQPVVDEIKKAYPTLPPNVFVIPPESKVSTYAVMLQCNAVIIYGTKTGVELTSMGVPVIVAGEAWIRNKGLTTDVTSEAQYTAVLDGLPFATKLSPEVVRRARMYAYHFFFRRMIPIDVAQPLPDTRGYDFDVPSIDALAPGKVRGLDVICEGILERKPFIFPAEQRGAA